MTIGIGTFDFHNKYYIRLQILIAQRAGVL